MLENENRPPGYDQHQFQEPVSVRGQNEIERKGPDQFKPRSDRQFHVPVGGIRVAELPEEPFPETPRRTQGHDAGIARE